MHGATAKVVKAYLNNNAEQTAEAVWHINNAPGNNIAKIRAVRVLNKKRKVESHHLFSDPIILEMEFWCLTSGVRFNPNFHIYNSHGVPILNAVNFEDKQWGTKHYSCGLYRSQCVIPGCLLNEGQYNVSSLIVQDTSIIHARKEEIVTFNVNDDGVGRGDYTGGWLGVIRPLLFWSIELVYGMVS